MKKVVILSIICLFGSLPHIFSQNCNQETFQATVAQQLVPFYQSLLSVGAQMESYFEPNNCARSLDYKEFLPKELQKYGFKVTWNNKKEGNREYFYLKRLK